MVCCTCGPATAVRRCHPRVSLSSHHDTPERTRPLIKVRPEQDLKKVRPEQFHITRAFRHALPRRLCATSQGLLRARRSSSRTEGTDTRGISGTRGTFMNSSSTYSSFHRSVLTFEIFLGNEISPPISPRTGVALNRVACMPQIGLLKILGDHQAGLKLEIPGSRCHNPLSTK